MASSLSRWLKKFTSFLLTHTRQALILTFLITFIPIAGLISILIATLITLIQGPVIGAWFTLAASLPYFLSLAPSLIHHEAIPLMLWGAILVAIMSNIVTYGFAVMFYKKNNLSDILQIGALLGVLLISIVHLIYPEIGAWWSKTLQASYDQAFHLVNDVLVKNDTNQANSLVFQPQLSQKHAGMFASGIMVGGILFFGFLQMIMGLWWEGVLFHPSRLKSMLHQIRLSHLAGILFISSLIFSYLGNAVVLDIMPILYLLFITAGLSLIHCFFGSVPSKMNYFWITLIYVVLILSLPFSLFMLLTLALLDIWFDLRKRFKKA